MRIMLPKLEKIKGIHPGTLLKWELKNRNLKSADLAHQIGEHKQTISAILNKRRSINPGLSIKLSKMFSIDKDYFMLVQASYDVKKIADSEAKPTPNLDNIRKVLFWDTDLQHVDWDKNKRAIIQRVLERGNDIELTEITSFYGKRAILNVAQSIPESRFPVWKKNVDALHRK